MIGYGCKVYVGIEGFLVCYVVVCCCYFFYVDRKNYFYWRESCVIIIGNVVGVEELLYEGLGLGVFFVGERCIFECGGVGVIFFVFGSRF